MSDLLQTIPSTEGARQVEPGKGQRFDIAGAYLTWKVRGEDTGYAFSVCEQDLAPGEGVPLHSHPYAEVFYILDGPVDFFRVMNGKEDWIRCETGSTIVLSCNTLHAFYNKAPKPCRVLGISTQLHQAFFDAVERADKDLPFSSLPPSDAMVRVAKIGSQYNMHFVPYDV
jgi:quercetin dioxygenase-like cupin family protein